MPTRRKALRLHKDAQAELHESVSFYGREAGERVARRFKEHVRAAFDAILSNPERFRSAPEIPGVQKLRLKHFPFSILYLNRPDSVWIVAVAHGSRKPGYWTERVR